MPNVTWSLQYGAAVKTFAGWWLNDPVIEWVNGNIDKCTFTSEGRSLTDVEIFPAGAQVTILRDGVQWFVGIITQVPREGSAAAENMHWEVSGPWYYFEQLIFQQAWNFPAGIVGPVSLTAKFSPRVFLNVATGGQFLTIGQQISNVVNFVAARTLAQYGAARVQTGTFTAGPQPAPDECLALTCAEAIRRQLKYCPDGVMWFDHKTSPPTFHCRTRRDLKLLTKNSGQSFGGVSLPLTDLQNVEGLQLTPRADLQRPSVLISYEQTNEIDGKSYRTVTNDIAPGGATGMEVGAFVAPINLKGFKSNVLRQFVETEDILSGDVSWWKSHVRKLGEANVLSVVITSVVRESQDGQTDLGFTRHIKRGAVAAWMNFTVQKVRVKALATYSVLPLTVIDVAQALDTKTVEVYLDLNTTNATTGSYSSVSVSDPGEIRPTGVAQWIYDAIAEVQYDATLTLIESDCAGSVRVGDLVNITGGRTEWATMYALVQSVREDISHGITSIRLSPVPTLDAGLLVDLLRVFRLRRRETALNTLDTAEAGNDNAPVDLPKDAHHQNNQDGNPIHSLLAVKSGATVIKLDGTSGALSMVGSAQVGSVFMNLAQIVTTESTPTHPLVSFREVKVCIKILGVDTTRTMIVLGSAPYRGNGDPA